MRLFVLAFALFSICSYAQAQSIITTFAGNGTAGFSGDNGPATSAALNVPPYVLADPAGNIYIADERNNRVRKVDTNGVITTVAGNGAGGFSGDGGPATSASLNAPIGLDIDGQGNLFITDARNCRVRKVAPSGTISTVAGSGTCVFSGDGGPALAAGLFNPVRTISDPAGNLYIADQSAHRVRRVGTNGIIATIAGTGTQGFAGDGGPATSALLNNPTALALDSSGNLYITDQFNHRVRKVTPAGVISTIAGTGSPGFSGDGGPATSAVLNFPGALSIDASGAIFVVDDVNYRVRRIAPDGIITTVAGNGNRGFSGDGGPATSAQLSALFGVTVGPNREIYIADSENNRIRKVTEVAASVTRPVFTAAGITNAASFSTGLVPGALLTIFGTNIARGVSGVSLANQFPLPTELGGVSATFNGTPAPLVAVVNQNGTEQISLQAPVELAGQTSATVVIRSAGVSSVAVTVPVASVQPGIFLIDGSAGVVVHASTNRVVLPSDPAVKGEALVIYATGLGAVTPPIATGAQAELDATKLHTTAFTPSVTIGGAGAGLIFSGLVPGYAGLYQVNVTVPQSAPSGTQDLVITMNGVRSNIAKLSIR